MVSIAPDESWPNGQLDAGQEDSAGFRLGGFSKSGHPTAHAGHAQKSLKSDDAPKKSGHDDHPNPRSSNTTLTSW